MHTRNIHGILVEHNSVESAFLRREVKIDFYYPENINRSLPLNLLFINDGQDLKKMGFASMLDHLINAEHSVAPLLAVGIHCAHDRKMEYGVAGVPDFKGRGVNAGLFARFIIGELLPLVQSMFGNNFSQKAYAGFSLGALMALDIVWKHADYFNIAGCFSGSFWWRSVDQTDDEYDDDQHRIMHQEIRKGDFKPGLKFFFQCGNMDETMDRNENGIIDSIDDTLDLVKELVHKGYDPASDIYYLEMPDGKHDVPTWGRAMPDFLRWAMRESN